MGRAFTLAQKAQLTMASRPPAPVEKALHVVCEEGERLLTAANYVRYTLDHSGQNRTRTAANA